MHLSISQISDLTGREEQTLEVNPTSNAFEAARTQQEKIVQAQPDYGPALCVLGLIDAALGRKDVALDSQTAKAK